MRAGRSSCILIPLLILSVDCGSATQTPSRPSAATVLEIRVGVSGNGATTIESGRTAQLFAQATMSDGTSSDVTKAASWQTSNASVATVSAEGLVSGVGQGEVSITATWGKSGTLALQVKPEECRYSFVPEVSSLGPLAQSAATVQVTTSRPDCSWALTEGSGWISILSGRTGIGNGTVTFSVLPNNYPSSRSSQLLLKDAHGVIASHPVEQKQPSCSYVVSPDAFVIVRVEETHTFRVDTTPDDCQWTLYTIDPYEDSIKIRIGGGYQGDQDVTFTAWRRYPVPTPDQIRICGLSGQNPCGIVKVSWLPLLR